MKIGLVSDAHCEFGQSFPEIPTSIDLLILAGDIGCPYKTVDELNKIDVPYFYIAGNHEFYRHKHSNVIRDVFNNSNGCYENGTMEFMGRKIHGCTLWTDMIKNGSPDISGYDMFMNDARFINGWSGEHAYVSFSESMLFLNKSIEDGDIVVTHHLPSFKSVHSDYASSDCNHFFASDLNDFIEDKKPSIWIHGHTHKCFDYMIGDTRVLCHPRGYPNEQHPLNKYEIKIIDI